MEGYCSQHAQNSGENLAGTAPNHQGFLFIEYPLPWEYKAKETLENGKEIKTAMKMWKKKGYPLRLQLMSGGYTTEEGPFNVYIYHEKGGEFRGFAYEVEDHSEVPQVLDDHFTSDMEVDSPGERQIFVCTHGAHDQCCGKFGYQFYEKIDEIVDRQNLDWEVWRSSHLGGHRFAPTLLVLPEGRYYGWLEKEEARFLVNYLKGDLVYIDKCRGLTALKPKAQVAELFTWKRVNMSGNNPRVIVEEKDSEFLTHIQYGGETEHIFSLNVEENSKVAEVYTSCDKEETTEKINYEVTHFEKK